MARHLRPALILPLVLACGLAAPLAAAQDAPAVPKPDCKRPEFPGNLASDNQKRAFGKDVKAYGECIKKYVAAQQKEADLHVKAANEAAAAYNSAVKELQAEIDAAKE